MGESLLTEPFARADGHLLCGAVRADHLAERFGTPLYVHDVGHVTERVRAFSEASASERPWKT